MIGDHSLDAEARRAELARNVERRRGIAEQRKADRKVQRETTARAVLTVETLATVLAGRIGGEVLSPMVYAEHLIQPYCACGPGATWGGEPLGWEFCDHFEDGDGR